MLELESNFLRRFKRCQIFYLIIFLADTILCIKKSLNLKKAVVNNYLTIKTDTVESDSKKVRFKDAGFPQSVVDQAPKLSRFMKVPVVKAKVGPQLVTMIADEKIFDSIPVKKEVKAVVSGMYITSVKVAHGKNELPPQKKKSAFKRTVEKLQEKAGATPIDKKKSKR